MNDPPRLERSMHPLWLNFRGEHVHMERELHLDFNVGFFSFGFFSTFMMVVALSVVATMAGIFSSSTGTIVTLMNMQIAFTFLVLPRFQKVDVHSLKVSFEHSLVTFILTVNIFRLFLEAEESDRQTRLGAFAGLVSNAGFVGVGIVVAHVMHLSWLVKVAGTVFIPLVHTLKPMHAERGVETAVMWSACAIAFALGYLIERAQRLLFLQSHMMMRLAAANRSADSRLNHVVKGLCGGANGLLQSLELQMSAGGVLEGPQAERLLRQTREMLDEAAAWCHRRQIFVQLEAGTYVSTPVECDVQAQLQEMAGSHDVQCDVAAARVDASMFRLILQEVMPLTTYIPHSPEPHPPPHPLCPTHRRCPTRASTATRAALSNSAPPSSVLQPRAAAEAARAAWAAWAAATGQQMAGKAKGQRAAKGCSALLPQTPKLTCRLLACWASYRG